MALAGCNSFYSFKRGIGTRCSSIRWRKLESGKWRLRVNVVLDLGYEQLWASPEPRCAACDVHCQAKRRRMARSRPRQRCRRYDRCRYRDCIHGRRRQLRRQRLLVDLFLSTDKGRRLGRNGRRPGHQLCQSRRCDGGVVLQASQQRRQQRQRVGAQS